MSRPSRRRRDPSSFRVPGPSPAERAAHPAGALGAEVSSSFRPRPGDAEIGSPALSFFSNVLRVHERFYKATDGRVGHRLLGVPTLLLRTTGRRSGVTRTNGLVYARNGADYLVVASKGGSDQPPAWLLNLEAKPEVEIQVGRERQKAGSTVVESSGPDYARLWKIVNENNGDRYTAYQDETSRPIPVVVITPI